MRSRTLPSRSGPKDETLARTWAPTLPERERISRGWPAALTGAAACVLGAPLVTVLQGRFYYEVTLVRVGEGGSARLGFATAAGRETLRQSLSVALGSHLGSWAAEGLVGRRHPHPLAVAGPGGFRVGDRVWGRYGAASEYKATVAAVRGDGGYTVDWDDGDEMNRVRGAEQLRRIEDEAHGGAAAGVAWRPEPYPKP